MTREEWNCRNLTVAMDSRQDIRGPCLVKEVAGWTTAVAAGLHLVVKVCWGDG